MPRKPGSKDTKPRKRRGEATAAGPANPAPGHNSGVAAGSDLTEQEKRAAFIQSVVAIEGFIEDKDSFVAKIRNERKRLKGLGFSTMEVDYALKLRKADDNESIEQWRKMQRIAVFLNHPIGSQPDMFNGGDGVDRTPLVERARAAGELAGLEAKGPLKPPPEYTPGTEAYAAYIEAWHKGQALLLKDGIKAKPADKPNGSTLIKANAPGAAPTTSNDGGADAFDDTLPAAGQSGEAQGNGAENSAAPSAPKGGEPPKPPSKEKWREQMAENDRKGQDLIDENLKKGKEPAQQDA